ncbi:hypothetical protein Nepgr_015335 [Nepenthes gracilis]|uniref:Uncharacterized protein n=1 Tax=Nepenthes gracilis TaxID=150966 RepID=A0AAD3SMQ1_NEPGR|nr:hypothetical protein Nepgr_015335 [Nepenthes gracilis]
MDREKGVSMEQQMDGSKLHSNSNRAQASTSKGPSQELLTDHPKATKRRVVQAITQQDFNPSISSPSLSWTTGTKSSPIERKLSQVYTTFLQSPSPIHRPLAYTL